MNSTFKTYYIREIGKVSMCKRVLKEETFENEEIPFYKISTFGGKADTFITRKHFEEYRRKYSFPKVGEILISAAGTIGKTVIYNGEDGYFQDSNIVWVENDEKKVRNDFLYYFFQTKPWFTTHGSTITRIYNENLRSIKLNVPENLNDQKRIASVLSALDSKIELNKRINAELEAMAKTLYDYWFVQFDFPYDFAKGKPDKNGKPYKSSGGKMVWSEELKREVPEGWGIEKMKKVLTIKNGRDHKHLELGTIPVYGSGGIMRYANNSIYDSESILIPRKGTLSNLFYVNEPFWCVDTIFYTQMKFPHTCKYLYYTIRAFNISTMNTGTAVPSMTTEILNNLLLIFPSLEILRDFDNILNPIFQKVDRLKLENQKLSELRDWLLPMLMNGQVKVI